MAEQRILDSEDKLKSCFLSFDTFLSLALDESGEVYCLSVLSNLMYIGTSYGTV